MRLPSFLLGFELNTSYHAQPKRSRKQLYKLLQTAALSSLILTPLVIGACLYSQTEETDPHVFIISRNSEKPSEVSLVIMGAVSSFSRIEKRPENLFGPMETSCYINNNSNLTGHILLINLTSPKCRILIEEDFIVEKLERAKVSGAVVLDDTPRSEWRVSSLASSPLAGVQHSLVRIFNHGTARSKLFPVVLVRSADWRRHEDLLRQEGSNLYISWNSVRQEVLNQQFGCSDEKALRITEGQVQDGHCKSGKFLSSSGDILERLCVKSQCTKFGGKCPRHFDFPPGQFSIDVKCDPPAVSSYQFQTSGGDQIKPVKLWSDNPSGLTEYCCQNNTYLELLGEGCFERWSEVRRYSESCRWSVWAQEDCQLEMMKVYRLCHVTGMDCVVSEFYLRFCHKDRRLPLCSDSQNSC